MYKINTPITAAKFSGKHISNPLPDYNFQIEKDAASNLVRQNIKKYKIKCFSCSTKYGDVRVSSEKSCDK